MTTQVRNEAPKTNTKLLDVALLLKDAGAITADGVTQVDGADKVLEIGHGRYTGEIVVDITAIDVASGNETYAIRTQFSDDAGFGSGVVNGATLEVGAAVSGADATEAGRYVLPFTNVVGDVQRKYMRVFVDVGGTSPSIDFQAFVGKLDGFAS